MNENWVIDGSFDPGETGMFIFIPVRGMESGEPVFVIGMNFISDRPPPGGRLVGVIHADGDAAANAFCERHKDAIRRIRERQDEEGQP